MLAGVRSLTLSESVRIHAPLHAVRAAFDDLERWPEWNSVCIESRWTSGEPWAVGAAFSMRLRMARRPVRFNVHVIDYDPTDGVAWESTVLSVTGTRRFSFAAASDGEDTLVTDEKTFHSPILPVRLFYPRPIIQAMSRGWLSSLKLHTES